MPTAASRESRPSFGKREYIRRLQTASGRMLCTGKPCPKPGLAAIKYGIPRIPQASVACFPVDFSLSRATVPPTQMCVFAIDCIPLKMKGYVL